MPNEHAPKSSEGLDPPEKNFVYDFLYHDVHRIGSFLSQFDPNGYLQSSSSSKSLSQSRNASSEKSLNGKLPAIVEAESKRSYGNTEINTNDSLRTYDPLWQNSLSLLDYLEQRSMISRDILHSRIGQFVLVSGNLFMFDIGFFQKLLQKQNSNQAFINGFINASANKTSAKNEAKEILELIVTLPNSIQAILMSEEFSTWSILPSEGLSLSTDDLLLKHGPSIAGEWNILGILDALPDNRNIEIDLAFLPHFQKILADHSRIIRPKFGRDPKSFGITPLLIFREVSGN